MAEGEAEPWVETTKDTLGKLISKPKMTDKYLKKPPFRFLHDIVMEVTRATQFAQGLYSPEESDAAQLADKQAKVDFLNKAISVTAFALGEKIDVSANKIVAGLEADKTNAWLQKLHAAATTCVGAKSDEAVSRVKNGESIAVPKKEKKKKEEAPADGAAAPPAPADGAEADPEAEKKRKDEERRKKRAKEKEAEKKKQEAEAQPPADTGATDNGAAEAEAAAAAAEEEKRQKREEEKRQKEERAERKRKEKEEAAAAAAREAAAAEEAAQAAMQQQQQEEMFQQQQQQAAMQEQMYQQQQLMQEEQIRASPPPDHMPDGMGSAPGSAAQGQRPGAQGLSPEEIAQNAAAMLPREDAASHRPKSAGRRPPRGKRQVQNSAEHQAEAAPAPVVLAEGVKDDEDDDCFEAPPDQQHLPGLGGGAKADESGVHGKLVSNLLAEKKKEEESEQERLKREEEATREEFDDGTKGIKMGKVRRKEKGRENQVSEVDTVKLGEVIQRLCEAANPLGKSIDLVHQDIANMGKELDHWKQEYREATEQYTGQLAETENVLQPLYQQVADLDDKIEEQTEKIRNSRSRIAQNDLEIEKLLSTVVMGNR